MIGLSLTKKGAGPCEPARQPPKGLSVALGLTRIGQRDSCLRYLHHSEERHRSAAPLCELLGVEPQVGSLLGTLDGILEVRDALDRAAVDLGDDHARPHELLVKRAGRGDTGDDDTLDVVRNGVALPQAAGQVLVLDAQPIDAAAALGLALLRLLVLAGAFPQL